MPRVPPPPSIKHVYTIKPENFHPIDPEAQKAWFKKLPFQQCPECNAEEGLLWFVPRVEVHIALSEGQVRTRSSAPVFPMLLCQTCAALVSIYDQDWIDRVYQGK